MWPKDPRAPINEQRPSKPARDLYDWLMFTVGALGVAGVVATIGISRADQASNGKDVAKAISQMRSIAQAMHNERPLLKRQADAAASSANAAATTARIAEDQLNVFRGQTGAIVRQADALITSAQATVKATDAQLAAAHAITAAQQPAARFNTLDVTGMTDVKADQTPIEISVKWDFLNAGNVSIFPGRETFNFIMSENIPNIPPKVTSYVSGGNTFASSPHTTFGPLKPWKLIFPGIAVSAFRDAKVPALIWGDAYYTERGGAVHHFCYAYAAYWDKERGGASLIEIKQPRYTCPET